MNSLLALLVMSAQPQPEISSAALSGRRLYVLDVQGGLTKYDVSDGRRITKIVVPIEARGSRLTARRDGSILLTGQNVYLLHSRLDRLSLPGDSWVPVDEGRWLVTFGRWDSIRATPSITYEASGKTSYVRKFSAPLLQPHSPLMSDFAKSERGLIWLSEHGSSRNLFLQQTDNPKRRVRLERGSKLLGNAGERHIAMLHFSESRTHLEPWLHLRRSSNLGLALSHKLQSIPYTQEELKNNLLMEAPLLFDLRDFGSLTCLALSVGNRISLIRCSASSRTASGYQTASLTVPKALTGPPRGPGFPRVVWDTADRLLVVTTSGFSVYELSSRRWKHLFF